MMFSLLSTRAFALLGAVALFNLISDLVAAPDKIKLWIGAWENITRPIWDFVLGWAFDLVEIQFPSFIKDYLTCGVIGAGMFFRSVSIVIRDGRYDIHISYPNLALILFIIVPTWPLTLVAFVTGSLLDHDDGHEIDDDKRREMKLIFFETAIYFFLILGACYSYSAVSS